MCFDICDKQRIHNALISALANKNLKVKAECLDVLATFISQYNVDFTSQKDAKLIAKLVDNSDKSVRENALNCLNEVNKILDEGGIWRIIGEVPRKVQDLLE